MVYLKENYIFKVPEGVQHFTGEGVQIFSGGGGGEANVNIDFVNFQGLGSGPLDPRMRMIDPLAFTVKPIPKSGFLMQWLIFHCSRD